jgi:Caspase domain
MRPARFLLPAAAAAQALLGGAAAAAADTPPAAPDIASYALVVGSNLPGPGQAELRYAEDDARKVAATLTEIGGYAPGAVDVLVRPTPDALRQRLDRITRRVAADVAAGKQARFVFYYSGHARSTALDLGPAALPLDELRQRLLAVPATLKIVVLDACQSGAFSRVKGATPAADFSFNSRQHLDASGVAVLASSSGSELSQESELLRGSYFTHHLLVGLRGAGDANRDGAVSVDEAYRYAYHHTLAATAATAVGGQHVILEVELKGHGEVPLSFPRPATSSIELPAQLAGHTLIQDRQARAIVAEVHKAKGAPVRVAVAPGEYDVIARTDAQVARCPVTAGPGGAVVDLGRCTREALAPAARKGAAFQPRWRVELAGAIERERRDAYRATLIDTFDYREDRAVSAEASLGVLREYARRGLWLGGFASQAAAPTYVFDVGEQTLRFSWQTTRVGALAQGDRMLGRGFAAFARASAGLGIARTRFVDQDRAATHETFVGPAFELGAGLRIEDLWLDGFAMSLGGSFEYAPIIENELGERHDSGGFRARYGLSYTW